VTKIRAGSAAARIGHRRLVSHSTTRVRSGFLRTYETREGRARGFAPEAGERLFSRIVVRGLANSGGHCGIRRVAEVAEPERLILRSQVTRRLSIPAADAVDSGLLKFGFHIKSSTRPALEKAGRQLSSR
jgi:hypothetical protein